MNQTDKQSLSSEDSHSSKMMGWLLAPVTYSFAPVPKLILACIFFLNSSPSFPIHGRFPQNVIWKSTQLKPTLLNPASFPDSVINGPTPYLPAPEKSCYSIPSSLMQCPYQPFQLLIKFQKLSLNSVLPISFWFF